MPLWTDRGFGFREVQGARADVPSVAFLCCPGPSLAHVTQDLRGPGRTVYALNTAYAKIHPDAWIGLDRMGCFDPQLWHEAFPKIARKFDDDNIVMRHHPNVFFADIDDGAAEEMFIRRDNKSTFVWAKNSFVFALHFLIWSGHKRIHLIGCDMGGGSDYYDERVLTLERRGNNRRLYDDLVATVRRLQPLALRNGIEFVSSTADSPLNAFLPTQSIPDAIKHAEKDVPPHSPGVHVRDTERHLDRQVVLVLKSGGEYKLEHANRLINQLQSCTITLLTDFPVEDKMAKTPNGSKCYVRPLEHDWPGWWAKMNLFSPTLFSESPNPSRSFLYLDLDTTVFELPDAFFQRPSSTLLAPFTDADAAASHPFQTGMMLLHPRGRAAIWNKWREDPEKWMREFRGDQDFVSSLRLNFDTWSPDEVVSYKKNWRIEKDYHGNPLDKSKVKVVAWHGHPRPWHRDEIQRVTCRQ